MKFRFLLFCFIVAPFFRACVTFLLFFMCRFWVKFPFLLFCCIVALFFFLVSSWDWEWFRVYGGTRWRPSILSMFGRVGSPGSSAIARLCVLRGVGVAEGGGSQRSPLWSPTILAIAKLFRGWNPSNIRRGARIRVFKV